MDTPFQKGQKVATPEGGGLIEDIMENEIRVKLESGEVKAYQAQQLEDDADQG